LKSAHVLIDEKNELNSFPRSKYVERAVKVARENEKFWYLNINKENGNYTVSENNPGDGDYKVEIRSIYKNGFLLQCYSSGHINKVNISSILSKKVGREYSNGFNTDDELIHIEVIGENKILGIKFKVDGETYFKGHLTEKISSRDLLYLKGYKVMYNDFEEISYTTFPMNFYDDIKRLVFSSFIASGKPIKNKYYDKEWDFMRKFLVSRAQTEIRFEKNVKNNEIIENQIIDEEENDLVEVGDVVKFSFKGKVLKVKIVSFPTKAGINGNSVCDLFSESPLAQALVGQNVGDKVRIEGTDNYVEIIEISQIIEV